MSKRLAEVFVRCEVENRSALVGYLTAGDPSVETSEKLRKSSVNWRFTEGEKKEIYLRWLEKSIKSIDLIRKNYLLKEKKI